MKILFITDPITLGGATGALIMLTNELKAHDCDITVCISRSPELAKKLKSSGISVIDTGHIPAMVNRPRRLYKRLIKKALYTTARNTFLLSAAVKKAERAADISSFDIIHTNSARSDLGCLLSKKYGIPHIIHLREFGIEDFGCMLLRKDYYSYLNSHAERFIAVSDAVKESWIKKGIDHRRITRIYDGIDTKRIISKSSENLGTLKLMIVGGVCPAKGQHICIKAVRALPPQIRSHVTLDIIGWDDPYYRAYLDRLVNKYELGDRVRFLGKKDNVGELLCNYDIGLMSSRSEGFGLVTAEYMTAGLCVIASDSGANPELITDGRDGLLFKTDSPKSLARCIVRLYNDRKLMKELALCGQEKARREFTAERNADEILMQYKKLCRKGCRHEKQQSFKNGLDHNTSI